VIFDRLAKYTHFFSLSHLFKYSTVATAFMETIQKIHGSQKIILSDRDPIFTGHFWTELFVRCGAWLSSCFIGLCFQPCLYPMKTVHTRILYTPPCGGVVGGDYPPCGVHGKVGPQHGFGGQAPKGKIAL